MAQWLEHPTREPKVPASSPCMSGWRIFFSGVNFLCWLLFLYPFHPRVTAVARKKILAILPKVQVAGYSWTRMYLRMRLCMTWHCKLHGLHTTCAETAAVWRGWHKPCKQQQQQQQQQQKYKQTNKSIFFKCDLGTPLRWRWKTRAIKSNSHSFRITWDMSAESVLESRK